MSYVAANPKKFIGRSIGNGQCVAFARAAANMPHSGEWGKGELVQGAALAFGTAIATFDKNGRYANDTHGASHVAIYIGQDARGIKVLDQWVEKRKLPDGSVKPYVQNVTERTIYFGSKPKPVNDGRNYYVVE
jgi:hypothetical protein